jgi:hypothetical protein
MNDYFQHISDEINKYGKLKGYSILLLFIVVICLSIWYRVYQYNICYPNVSNNVFYCIQHAFGN